MQKNCWISVIQLDDLTHNLFCVYARLRLVQQFYGLKMLTNLKKTAGEVIFKIH